jgi:hypothetical protein
MRIWGILLVSLGILAGQTAAAQEPGEGLLNAVAYKPLPQGLAVTVRPLDNSDENLLLQEEFERELRASGHTVAADAPLIMTFEVRDMVGAWSNRDRRSILEFEGSGGGIGGDSHRARLNLFDSGRGGVLNQGRGGGTSIVTPTKYRLDATIDARAGGKRLWQAWATADLGQSDGFDLTKAMIPAVVNSLGQTVKRQPFKVP